jgi:hypothetical protein
VFGNDRLEPDQWLGHLKTVVRYYFLTPDGTLQDLSKLATPGEGWSQLSSSAVARDWASAEDGVYDEPPALTGPRSPRPR